MTVTFPDYVVDDSDTRIIFVVMDGVGGLPHPETGRTELESADTPNLDRLARESDLGLIRPVAHGITPGSGPGHLSLFGYDPVEWNIGRGVLSALGVGFKLREGDLAARLNFATVDDDGLLTDRRAGRPTDEEGHRLVRKLREEVEPPPGVELYWEAEKEHRAALVMRGANLSAELSDTDPQETGVAPQHVRPLSDRSKGSARVVQSILDSAMEALRDEDLANAILARGFATFRRYPSMADRYRLLSLAIARYPMYQGVARLLGMDVHPTPRSDEDVVEALRSRYLDYEFHFVHFKSMDSRGEDGDFDAKVEAIESVDRLIPGITELEPDVLVVTGDHSTPSSMRYHSWHPVPLLIASRWNRPAAIDGFGESDCLRGSLGIFPAKELMSLVLANAGRLDKFGA